MGDDTHDVLRTQELLATDIKAGNGAATGSLTISSRLTLADGVDLNINTSTGTEIGRAANQKIGFWGATPVIQEDVTAAGISAATLLTALDKIGILNSV